MNTSDYLKLLVDEIHSVVVASIDSKSHPTEDGRKVLEVFCFTYGRGEFYDLTVLPPRIYSFEINGE